MYFKTVASCLRRLSQHHPVSRRPTARCPPPRPSAHEACDAGDAAVSKARGRAELKRQGFLAYLNIDLRALEPLMRIDEKPNRDEDHRRALMQCYS